MANVTKYIAKFTSTLALTKESGLLIKAIGKQDSRIQDYLLSELIHIEEHRNPTRLNQFLDRIKSKGSRADAMHKFIQNHFNVVFQTKPEKLADGSIPYYRMKDKRGTPSFNKALSNAIETPWFLAKAPAKIQAFDLEVQIKILIANAEKASKDEKRKDISKIDSRQLDALRALVTHEVTQEEKSKIEDALKEGETIAQDRKNKEEVAAA